MSVSRNCRPNNWNHHDMNASVALLIALAGNLLYHLVMRSAPKSIGAFSFLAVAYLVAGLVSLGIAMRYEAFTVGSLSRVMHPSAFGIALAALVIEAGYLIAYRNGAAIGSASLLVNATVAVLLAIVGYVAFREKLSAQAIVGIVITAVGVLTLAFAKPALPGT
jgi:drug/metabolite transporter (DMT)-like permease